MNTIIRWINSFVSLRNYTLRNYTAYLLILFCIQYIPIESRAGASWLKVVTMAITASMMLKYLVFNKALVIALTYIAWIMLTAYAFHGDSFRASTVVYLFMFVITFTAFYTFLWDYQVFDIDFFINLVRKFIFVLVGVLLVQQVCILAGFKLMPLVNLCQVLNREIGANSLTFEPSTFGRLISVLLYAYLKCNQYKKGTKVTLAEMFSPEHRKVAIAYLWAVLTMSSGTAFVAMAFVSLYFVRGWSVLYVAPLFVLAYFAMDHYGNKSFQRVQATVSATSTLNAKTVRNTDTSAATRILPIINTLKIDLNDSDIWTGKGCDSVKRGGGGHFSEDIYMGNIGDYGLIGFLICVIFTFVCVVPVFSLPTLMMLGGVAGFVGGNVSYVWGLLMIFTCVSYFRKQQEQGLLEIEDDNEEGEDENGNGNGNEQE